jgi:PAS domain S-box-containing protein
MNRNWHELRSSFDLLIRSLDKLEQNLRSVHAGPHVPSPRDHGPLEQTAGRSHVDDGQFASAEMTSADLYRRVVEDQTDLIVRWLPHGVIQYVNPACCRYFRMTAEDAATISFFDLVHPEDRDAVRGQVLSRAITDPIIMHEHRGVDRDGGVGWIEWIDLAIFDDRGQLAEFQSVGRDTTERKRIERQFEENREALLHASRLATMSAMIAGIAHETLQPLTSIQTLSLAMSRLLTNGQSLDVATLLNWTNSIRQSVRMADSIIRRFRSFVEKRQTERRRERLDDIIANAVQLLNFEARRLDILIDFNATPEPVEVVVDRIQIEQVIVNLIKNSLEAIAGDPKNSPQRINVSVKVDGRNVEITVSDQGPGVPENQRQQLFEAFQMTKPTGMGLGLAICRTIMEMHDGRIWYTPNIPRGACFHLRLPVASEDAADA